MQHARPAPRNSINRNIFLAQTVLGKVVHRPAKLDQKLVREFMALADPTQDAYDTVSGKTMCTNDFYEGES